MDAGQPIDIVDLPTPCEPTGVTALPFSPFNRSVPALLALTLIGACNAAPVAPQPEAAAVETGAPRPGPTPSPSPATTPPRLTVAGDGLRWILQPGGSARAVAFGVAEAPLVASVEKWRGPAKRSSNPECGAGPVDFATWDDGLSLLFQEGRFVGWGLDRHAAGRITTAAGIGPGSTRADVESAYDATISETTLGTEFAAGDLYGLFDGGSKTAKVTDLWAGVSCFAR